MAGKLWYRYIFWELTKTFVFFLFCFYLLYVAIDFSTHFQELIGNKALPISQVLLYYLLQFAKRAEILLPLGLMIATIKVVSQMQENREWLALRACGVAQKKLLIPVFTLGMMVLFGALAIEEYTLPYSLNFIDRFYDHHLRHSYKGNRKEPIHIAHLMDQSRLIYQSFEREKDAFFDVFLYNSADDIWRIKYFYPFETPPRGEFVDHIVRNLEGVMEKVEEHEHFSFPNVHWDTSLPRKGYFPCENRSLTQLKQQSTLSSGQNYLAKQEALTHLLFKLAMPLLNILCLIAVLPFCVRFKRDAGYFLLYALSLFGLITVIAFMDACVILGENATVSPYTAILLPFSILFVLFGTHYHRAVR